MQIAKVSGIEKPMAGVLPEGEMSKDSVDLAEDGDEGRRFSDDV